MQPQEALTLVQLSCMSLGNSFWASVALSLKGSGRQWPLYFFIINYLFIYDYAGSRATDFLLVVVRGLASSCGVWLLLLQGTALGVWALVVVASEHESTGSVVEGQASCSTVCGIFQIRNQPCFLHW